MKMYVVAGRYQRTQDEAKARAKAVGVTFNGETDWVDVPTKQAELAEFLNNLVEEMFTAGKNSVGGLGAMPVQSEPAKPSYAEQSVAIDDMFGRAPVPQQLTLATLAMQAAQDEIARLHKLINPVKPDAAVRAAAPPEDVDDLV